MDSTKKGESLEILRARIFEKLERTTQKLHALQVYKSEQLAELPEEMREGLEFKKGEALGVVWLTERIREEMQTMTREELEEMSDELDQLAQVVEVLN